MNVGDFRIFISVETTHIGADGKERTVVVNRDTAKCAKKMRTVAPEDVRTVASYMLADAISKARIKSGRTA